MFGAKAVLGRCILFILEFFILQNKCICVLGETYVEVGNNVTLKCISESSNIWWTKNGQNITSTQERTILTSIPINDFVENRVSDTTDLPRDLLTYSHNFHLLRVQLTDEGNYTCHTNAEDSEISENSFFVQPSLKPKVVASSSPRVRIKIGQPTVLYCVIETYPLELIKSQIKWEKDSLSLPFLNANINITTLNSTHVNTTLELHEVYKKENGTYSCLADTATSGNDVPKKDIAVLVLDVPQVSIDFVKAVGANKIFLNWTVNDGNDAVQKYFVQYKEEGTTEFTYYNHVIGGRNSSYVLDFFKANTSYMLRMSAKNSIGDGPHYSYQTPIRTLPKDPIFIPHVEIPGSTPSTITIGWHAPPLELLEFIQYYELVVSEIINNEMKIVDRAVYQQNSRNLPYMFDNLKTATDYEFKVRACSELSKICGPWSEAINGTTMDGSASPPTNLNVLCTTQEQNRNLLNVSWDLPKNPNGKVVSYLIHYNGIATYVEDGKPKTVTWGPKISRVDEPNRKAAFEGVVPNTNYSVTVSAITRNKKNGETATAHCTMPVALPIFQGRVSWSRIKSDTGKWIFKLFIPNISERNGRICCYRIYLVRVKGSMNDLVSPVDLAMSTYHEVHAYNNSKGGAYIAEMFPSEEFRSEIFLGDGRRIYKNELTKSRADAICWKCLEGHTVRPINDPTTLDKNEVPPISPTLTQREHLTRAANLTPDASKILHNRRRKRIPKFSIDEGLVESKDIPEVSTIAPVNADFEEIFDGELDMGSNYTGFIEIIVRDESSKGPKILTVFSDFFELNPVRNIPNPYEPIDDFSLIFKMVSCGLILLALLLFATLCFMHRHYTKGAGPTDDGVILRSLSRAWCGGRNSNHRHLIGSAMAKPADIGPIPRAELPQAYKNRHKDTDYGFLREYEMLPSRFNDRTTKNSDAKENAHKNRYPDIKAYDQTRVKLSQINSILGSDYINSNFVIGYKERKKFICAQGPMESTITDFWRMIWEQHLEIIVMLTNLEEYNKAKCAKYWPEKISDSRQFGDITVTFAAEQRFSDFVIRTLDVCRRNISNEDEEDRRQITQYHYLVWKDFMAPEHPHGIIKFIRQINSVYSVQRGPILVHCSAGVGRTGTLVALDSLLQQLEEEGHVSIFNTVCDLRHQRNFLVQSLKQYIFLYRALLDIAQYGNTELQARGLSAAIENLKQKSNDGKEISKLEAEFEKIKSIADETNKSCSVGSGDENMHKNRSELVIPYDRNRVILTPIPTREHSTYINASFIEGYDNFESFIITQDPMENTIGDFWRMISEQSITTLVMISEIGDGPRKCPRYWADDEIQYDHILVKYMHSESCPYYTRREFNVTNCKIDDTIKVTQFQYNGWPTVEGEVPEVCRGIIELVDQAQNHHVTENNFSTPTPIAVHCSLGTDRSSIFVTMCILVQQLRTEKKIDICTTARKLRSQRSMLLDTYAQYEFLHRAIANYADLHKLSTESPTDC